MEYQGAIEFMEYEILNYSLDLDCFETKGHCFIMNIENNMIIMIALEGNIGKCHPEKTNVDRGVIYISHIYVIIRSPQ